MHSDVIPPASYAVNGRVVAHRRTIHLASGSCPFLPGLCSPEPPNHLLRSTRDAIVGVCSACLWEMTGKTIIDSDTSCGRIRAARPIRLAAQDAALSRQKHEFESRMGHSQAQTRSGWFNPERVLL